MNKIVPYLFGLLMVFISYYYASETPSSSIDESHALIDTLMEQYRIYPHLYDKWNDQEGGNLNNTSLLDDVKETLAYLNLSWYDLQYINSVNKQAVEDYQLAKTQEERNEILQKHPQYFTKIGRPLLRK